MKQKLISNIKLRKLGYNLFEKVGLPAWHYSAVVDGLILASLRGVDSHGIRLLPIYIEAVRSGRIKKTPNFTFRRRAPSVGIFDADHAFGICAGVKAMEKAIDLAKKTGVGAVAVKNSSHFGAAAIFSLLAAQKNMIGISMTHASAHVVPFGAREPFFGTNPICIAAPCMGEEPICLDMATSQVAWNRIQLHKERGLALEDSWATDERGQVTRDPNKAKSLLPLGGYKGYALGMMVDVFCSMLTGMTFGPKVKKMTPVDGQKQKIGHFFLAIDISKFTSVVTFRRRTKEMADQIRRMKPARDQKVILVAGDPEKSTYKKRVKSGIPLTFSEITSFNKLAQLWQLRW